MTKHHRTKYTREALDQLSKNASNHKVQYSPTQIFFGARHPGSECARWAVRLHGEGFFSLRRALAGGLRLGTVIDRKEVPS